MSSKGCAGGPFAIASTWSFALGFRVWVFPCGNRTRSCLWTNMYSFNMLYWHECNRDDIGKSTITNTVSYILSIDTSVCALFRPQHHAYCRFVLVKCSYPNNILAPGIAINSFWSLPRIDQGALDCTTISLYPGGQDGHIQPEEELPVAAPTGS